MTDHQYPMIQVFGEASDEVLHALIPDTPDMRQYLFSPIRRRGRSIMVDQLEEMHERYEGVDGYVSMAGFWLTTHRYTRDEHLSSPRNRRFGNDVIALRAYKIATLARLGLVFSTEEELKNLADTTNVKITRVVLGTFEG